MQKKKLLLSVLVILVVVMLNVLPASAEPSSNIGILVNNQSVISGTSSVYMNGVILAPAKELANSMGGTFRYNEDLMTGTIQQGENELVFRLDNGIVKFNGKNIAAPVPMKVVNMRFMVPVEFTALRLGAEVYMNTYKNQLMIFQSTNGKLIYQVMPGDSLWIVSQIFKTTISAIKQLNNLTSDTVYVGQKLVIKSFTPFTPIMAAYTTKNATLRSGAGFDFGALGYLSAWTSISVVGKNGDWFKVVTPKGNGYIYYTIISVSQDLNDYAPDSTYFQKVIPLDTSGDYITYISYTVDKGDTLWGISEKMGIPDFELAQANNLSVTSTLYIGQVLKIPRHIISVKSTLGPQYGEVLDWTSQGQYIFPINKAGKFTDMQTGKSFWAKRTIGADHADVETVSAYDSQIMKEIFGGSWTWDRKPFILEVDGRRFAVSISGMPHAGVDGVPFMKNVDNRSGNYGYGPNYDRIPGNGMDGHFDVYFLNGRRHVDSKIDSAHQYNVIVSGGLQ